MQKYADTIIKVDRHFILHNTHISIITFGNAKIIVPDSISDAASELAHHLPGKKSSEQYPKHLQF